MKVFVLIFILKLLILNQLIIQKGKYRNAMFGISSRDFTICNNERWSSDIILLFPTFVLLNRLNLTKIFEINTM